MGLCSLWRSDSLIAFDSSLIHTLFLHHTVLWYGMVWYMWHLCNRQPLLAWNCSITIDFVHIYSIPFFGITFCVGNAHTHTLNNFQFNFFFRFHFHSRLTFSSFCILDWVLFHALVMIHWNHRFIQYGHLYACLTKIQIVFHWFG